MAALCHEESFDLHRSECDSGIGDRPLSVSNLTGFEGKCGQAPTPNEFLGVNSAVKISGSVSMYNASSLMYFRNRAE